MVTLIWLRWKREIISILAGIHPYLFTGNPEEIDRKVVELVKVQHEKARKILEENREKLDELAAFLYERETITGDEFMSILQDKR